ncbi:hypothetical protein KUV89_01115 [Marinobacter hydrocarbonoclasticus]|nr:hypothetical protein [Marinobacter nauticus]
MKVFTTLWGDIQQGSLARVPYFSYSILLVALGMALGIVVAMSLGIDDPGSNGELTQEQFENALSLPMLLLLIAASVLLSFAGLNLTAKRLRHMGLPGWPTTIALALLVAAISYGWSAQAGNGFQFLVWLTLLFTPGELFGSRNR